MHIAGIDLAAACEQRRLPGFQGVVAITELGEIRYASPSLEGRFGIEMHEVIGRNFVEFVDVTDAGQAVDSFGAVLATPGHHPALELRIGHAGGEQATVDVVAENCLATELGVVVMHIADARERSAAAHLMSAQANVVRQIALGGSLEQSLGAICDFAETAMPGRAAMAYVCDGDRWFAVGDGLPDDRARRVVEAHADGVPRYVGVMAMVDAEPKIARAVPECELWPSSHELVGDPIRGIWSVPIRHDRQAPCLGCIEVYCRDPAHPRGDDWAVLQLVSRLAAVAVDHAAMQRRLAADARVDPLTSIPNRRVITGVLADMLARGERPIVAFIDLDHLKVVNDGLGHEAGDQAIIAAAERLRRTIGDLGQIGRFGGDEFVMVADASRITPDELGNACVAAFTPPMVVAGRSWQVSASVGVVVADAQTSSGELIRDADAAMYEAKRSGRGRWTRFDSSTRASAVRRIRLEQQLRFAIDSTHIEGWFQPIIRTEDWSLCGIEVLARWRLPSGEWVPPAEFVALAEEVGLIDDLGLQMLDRALIAQRVLRAQGFDDVLTSVNLSPIQLRSERLFDRLVSGPYRGLQLEMTEQHIVDDSATTLDDLQRLLGLGVGLAIDDFGTGYSSLGALHRIPAGTLKLDRSLVARCDTPAGGAVIGAGVGIGQAFGMTVVAEGVESAEQAVRLRELGVSAVQGFVFARPEPLDLLVRRLLRGTWAWDVPRYELDRTPLARVSPS